MTAGYEQSSCVIPGAPISLNLIFKYTIDGTLNIIAPGEGMGEGGGGDGGCGGT
jgi:hypothetical protein